jgi:hypothetical protein
MEASTRGGVQAKLRSGGSPRWGVHVRRAYAARAPIDGGSLHRHDGGAIGCEGPQHHDLGLRLGHTCGMHVLVSRRRGLRPAREQGDTDG